MKVKQIVAQILLLVCVGLPPLHSVAIGPDEDLFAPIPGTRTPGDYREVSLRARALESQGAPADQTSPATPSSPHCDFESSPVDRPPLCLFAPPESIRVHNDQFEPSPFSFTTEITAPPPRHA